MTSVDESGSSRTVLPQSNSAPLPRCRCGGPNDRGAIRGWGERCRLNRHQGHLSGRARQL